MPDKKGPTVELTELGRAFASRLRFPEELEQAISEFWDIPEAELVGGSDNEEEKG